MRCDVGEDDRDHGFLVIKNVRTRASCQPRLRSRLTAGQQMTARMRSLVSPGTQTLTGEFWLLGTKSEVLRERALLHESERPQLSCNSRFGTDPAKTKILVLTSTDSCSETYPAVIEGKWLEITGVNSTNLGSVDGTRETCNHRNVATACTRICDKVRIHLEYVCDRRK
ncbi:hypothetical protein BO85DRAFT_294753 [Aspergillus piperis CBS 112811]|uniref:Uncharacterized protein n=1 Tax=Aspergillus piperis CBS 112811 TaxID=1448313 RepID=A0A8G1VLR0_9EURO|nr:hypothetical protein BO85DRAFT_294753 [Aspergillus piperis CBS 112811]RAH58069.1 hypothetical protein BO85DRAFT_294753 [Aspergillus piperis CBS 112811]